MSEDVYGTNPDDLGQFRRSDDDNVGFHSLLRSDDESEDNEVDNDDDDDDMEDEDYVPSDSPSTVAVISAAKSSPLLNLSSSSVQNLSDTELVQVTLTQESFSFNVWCKLL